MTYFLFIFCRSSQAITRQTITGFIKEGVYFADPPRYTPSPAEQEDKDANWKSMRLVYQPGRTPVIFARLAQGKALRREIEEAFEAVRATGEAGNRADLVRQLSASRQAISIEIDRGNLTEDAWFMLDNLESYLAKTYQGLVYAPDEGFYDENLHMILPVRSDRRDSEPQGGTIPVESMLADLEGGGQRRIARLDDLVHSPSRDPRVLDFIRTLLDDRSPCWIEQHYLGEVRLLAGLALLAEWAALGEPLTLRLRCTPPVTLSSLIAQLESTGLTWPEQAEDNSRAALDAFALARDHGLINEQDIELYYHIDLAGISTRWESGPILDSMPAGKRMAKLGADDPPLVTSSGGASEEDVNFYLSMLVQGDIGERAIALQNLARFPTGDPRVPKVLDPLLQDITPCLLQIPYRFGELRLLAGVALAAERWASSDDRPVQLRSTVPQTPDDLEEARAAAGLPAPPMHGEPLQYWLDLFVLLRDRGQLVERDFLLRHPVSIGWLGSGAK